MSIDYDRLMALQFADMPHTYTWRDTVLYALGLGVGNDPIDAAELTFVYEQGLKALPTQAVTLCWAPTSTLNLGVDLLRAVHGDQSLVLNRPLASAASLVGSIRIEDITDLGADKGALLRIERTLRDKDSGELVATSTMGLFCRGDGGFGGPPRERTVPHAMPQRDADCTLDRATLPQAALIYRLAGDVNPLHADPAYAARAGFPKPILHGLATYGIAGHAIVKTLCGNDPERLAELHGRFTSPVFPGETLRTEMWSDGNLVSFRVRVVERDKVAFDNGRAVLRAV